MKNYPDNNSDVSSNKSIPEANRGAIGQNPRPIQGASPTSPEGRLSGQGTSQQPPSDSSRYSDTLPRQPQLQSPQTGRAVPGRQPQQMPSQQMKQPGLADTSPARPQTNRQSPNIIGQQQQSAQQQQLAQQRQSAQQQQLAQQRQSAQQQQQLAQKRQSAQQQQQIQPPPPNRAMPEQTPAPLQHPNLRSDNFAHSMPPQGLQRHLPGEVTRQEMIRLRKALRKNLRGKPSLPIPAYGTQEAIALLLTRFAKTAILAIVLLLFLIGGFGSGVLFGYISTTKPVPADLLRSGSETTYLYDAKGEFIAKQTGSQNIDRRYVTYNQVEHTAIANAFIAIEDERYMTHIGIDPKRIASAILSALANGGTPTHGGSTIVQQTVKLVTGDNQVSSQRKIQEWYRAIMLDEQLSKTEIMELYLNLVPMGNSYVGIEAAAEGYFNKSAKDLTLPECAFLAAIPKGPAIYNPRTENGMRNTLRRQQVVLAKMYQLGKISRKDYDDALKTDIVLAPVPEDKAQAKVNSYFVEYVISQVVDRLVEQGLSRNIAYQYVSSGGLHIYTTMEPAVQAALDEAFSKKDLFQKNPSFYEDYPEKPEAGMVVINNKTGAIAGMQGGFGEKTTNLIWNRATDLQRQPGSSIKPLVAYGPALDIGKFVGSSIIQDKEVFFNGPDKPWPTNYDRQYRGPVTFRNALKGSLNVPAVTILKAIGVDTGKRYLKNMGIDWTKDEVGLAAAVGAPQHGVSPLQMAQAYATFPNNGVYRPAYAFTKVVDKDGNVILENTPEEQRIFKPETAFIMNTMLEENLRKSTSAFGMYTDAGKYGPVVNGNKEIISTGGKTGTTDSNVDKWFAGFTHYYTGAVWFGFDNMVKQTAIPEQDWENPVRIWRAVMDKIHINMKDKPFDRPNDIVERKINIYDGLLATPSTPSNQVMTEWYQENSPLIPKQNSGRASIKDDEDSDENGDGSGLFDRILKKLRPGSTRRGDSDSNSGSRSGSDSRLDTDSD